MQAQPQEFHSVQVGLTHLTPAFLASTGGDFGLSDPDRRRADRFHFTEDRARFVMGRRLLAAMIRDHRGPTPRPLEFALTEHGRPHLPHDPALVFSISHAGDVVAVALTIGARVGIDVEKIDRRLDLDPLAARIFNAADLARFRALPPADSQAAFFRAWTGKEAILKAQGLGLFGGVQEISVPLTEAPSPTIIPLKEKDTWHLMSLALPTGYLGAVTCDDPHKPVRVQDYTF